jgi:hypothetical protein
MATVELLELPREIRAQIFEIVVLSLAPRPSGPDRCRHTHYSISRPCGTNLGYQCVCYLPVRATGIDLLLVNRQINSEVVQIYSSLSQRKEVVYTIDGMIENVGRLFATPLCVPFPSQRINILWIDIRFYGNYDLSRGCVALWGSSMMALLTMILKRGPDFLRVHKDAGRPRVEIDTVILNLLSSPKVPEWMISSGVLLSPGETSMSVPYEELSLRAAEREIGNMLDCRPGLLRNNHTLYDGIGHVQSRASGVLRRSWDLASVSQSSQR